MLTFPFLQVDTFAAQVLQGNPAAVILEAEGLTDDQMQAIAREMNLSETAFVLPSRQADFAARFFTPAKEIPLPGHPVIATAHALAETGRWSAPPGQALRLETRKGIVPIVRRPERMGELWVLTQPQPEWGTFYPAELIAPSLRIAPKDIIAPPQTVNTGTPQLMVAVRTPALLAGLCPDLDRLARLTEMSDFFSVHVFALADQAAEVDVYARHFAPAAGVAEDPVTGSASGAMGAYLVHRHLVEQRILTAAQGQTVGRPGLVYIHVLEAEGQISAVEVGGQAVTVITGELRL